jgi:DNA modification methylase
LTNFFTLHHGDCLDVMRTLPDASVDAVVTDPPYGLSFMGKRGITTCRAWTCGRECLRVLKPGGHLLAFAGTRTQHRMAVRIEDAGFEIRDMIAWVYGSGFPKSLDVGKSLDSAEKKRWLDVCKALDNADQSAILEAWKEHSRTASGAGLSLQKSETATGMNTPKSGSVPASVLLQASLENSDADAVVAELSLTEARLISEANCNSAQSPAESSTTELKSPATSAASPPASLVATLNMPDSFALQSAWGWQGERTADKLKAVEALKIWLGSKPSSRQEVTSALCAALTADLKLITLSQSKTFQNYDTTRQMACASAISATITESTAENLISFTVDTLRNKAIDKAAGAEREVVGSALGARNGNGQNNDYGSFGSAADGVYSITAPATPEAQQWAGWGTALKPALEPITLARKPLEGTVAANVLAHGCGGLNVDGCRIETEGEVLSTPKSDPHKRGAGAGEYAISTRNTERMHAAQAASIERTNTPGRWPANFTHDGSEEVVGLLGEAARLFYCPKASKRDRDEGCEGLEEVRRSDGRKTEHHVPNLRTTSRRNYHPTVKPTALMRWLCRLITPPGGVVLDPFTGSGSTGKAAMLEGFEFIGIEREAEYVEIARARIEHAAQTPAQVRLPLGGAEP